MKKYLFTRENYHEYRSMPKLSVVVLAIGGLDFGEWILGVKPMKPNNKAVLLAFLFNLQYTIH